MKKGMNKLLIISLAFVVFASLMGCESKPKEVDNMEITLSTPFWKSNELIQVERTGTYTGTLLNDLPEGKGKFETENDHGDPWYYEGDFKNGLFNGYGVYYSPNYDYKEIGTHIDGVFSPTKTDLLQTICYNDSASCTLQPESISMLDNNPNIFPCETSEDMITAGSLVYLEFTYNMFTKKPSQHLKNLQHVSYATAEQVFEYDYFGHTYTTILASDDSWNYYKIFYYGSINVYDGDTISFTGLPVASTGFDNIGGGVTNVIVTIGSIVYLI